MSQNTPTDNAEWLDELYSWCDRPTPDTENERKCTYCGEYLTSFRHTAKAQILTHIDTVCREAERQGGTDELMEMLDMCLTNYAKTKNNDMKTLADYCNNRLTQLNPNKDTKHDDTN